MRGFDGRSQLKEGESRFTIAGRGSTARSLSCIPELVYRRYDEDELVDIAVLEIAMRCYYPEEVLRLIADHGFLIVNKWGGYAGEPYGEGPELIVEFARSV
jgi:hypothetical protein